jgi:hypothetical protein
MSWVMDAFDFYIMDCFFMGIIGIYFLMRVYYFDYIFLNLFNRWLMEAYDLYIMDALFNGIILIGLLIRIYELNIMDGLFNSLLM